MRFSFLATSVLAFGISSSGCGSGAATTADSGAGDTGAQPGLMAGSSLAREIAVLSDTEQTALGSSLSGFAFALWQEVRRDPATAENYAFSPASISIALGMAYAGAKADTASQMKAAMQITSSDEAYLRSLNWLDQQLESRAGDALKTAQDMHAQSGGSAPAPNPADYRLHVVNACWGDRTLTFEPPYLDTLATDFGAGVHLADFVTQPEVERLAINSWVAQETLDRIKDLIPQGEITGSTRAVLVNAMHLKLPWYEPFQQASTQPGTFNKSDGSTVSASFMNKRMGLPYAEDDTVQVVSLPLAGRAVELMVFLPKPTTTLAQWEDTLSSAYVQTLVASMKPQPIALALPRFTFTTASLSVAQALMDMGMTDAFTPNADFTGMTPVRLFISDVLHKAMIGVDENGVEAAAATAVVMKGGFFPDPMQMTIDRPFFFGLYDRPTATWLFLGHVTDPSS